MCAMRRVENHGKDKRMSKAKRPKAPKDLGPEGGRVWTAVMEDVPADWELTSRELAMLRNAAKQGDLVADLQKALDDEGVVAVGAAGQRRLSQVATELRQSRIAFARLLGEIPIPDEEDGKPVTSASQRGQKAAAARWKRGSNA